MDGAALPAAVGVGAVVVNLLNVSVFVAAFAVGCLLVHVVSGRRKNGPAIDDTQPIDIVDSAFADYQRSVADILDANPDRRDELVRQLNAATAEWRKAEFEAATHSLRRDPLFRLAMLRAERTRPTKN